MKENSVVLLHMSPPLASAHYVVDPVTIRVPSTYGFMGEVFSGEIELRPK